ncbi:MAG: hypothetical protein AB9M60_21120 [Leptothrix sp. (in: b-proteobacteria)]
MGTRQRYRRRPDRPVTAVKIDLDIDGFSYRKWGAEQRCRRGDWLVDNEGDVYTVAGDVFARTYRAVGPGAFVKRTPVWAETAATPGRVATKEGSTGYAAGDYLVSNNEDGSDAYAVGKAKFEAMYERDE